MIKHPFPPKTSLPEVFREGPPGSTGAHMKLKSLSTNLLNYVGLWLYSLRLRVVSKKLRAEPPVFCVHAVLQKVQKLPVFRPKQPQNHSKRPAHLAEEDEAPPEPLPAAGGGAAAALASLPKVSKSHGGPSLPMSTCKYEDETRARCDTTHS